MDTELQWKKTGDGESNPESYRSWVQADPRYNAQEAWPESLFPEASYHLFRECGCLITSLAIMLRHYGIEKETDEARFNPWILNQRLIERGAFSSNADLRLDRVSLVYPLEYEGSFPFSWEAMFQLYESGQPFLITVPGVRGARHFIVPDHPMEEDMAVIDCAWDKKTLKEFEQIHELRVFRVNHLGYRSWRQDDLRFNREEAWPAALFPKADFHYFRECGCLICSLAIMLRHHGIEKEADESRFNPWILYQKMMEHEMFDESANLHLELLDKLYPLSYQGSMPYQKETLEQLTEAGALCLLTVRGTLSHTHFVFPAEKISDDYLVIDPIAGIQRLSHYNMVGTIRIFFPAGQAPNHLGDSD